MVGAKHVMHNDGRRERRQQARARGRHDAHNRFDNCQAAPAGTNNIPCQKQDAAKQGISVRLSKLGPDGKALVCAVRRTGCLADAPPPPGPGVDLERLQALSWYPGGPCSWRLFNVYGQADGSVEARLQTSQFVKAASAEAGGT